MEHSKIDGVTLYRGEVESIRGANSAQSNVQSKKSEHDLNEDDGEYFYMEITYEYYMRYLDEFDPCKTTFFMF